MMTWGSRSAVRKKTVFSGAGRSRKNVGKKSWKLSCTGNMHRSFRKEGTEVYKGKPAAGKRLDRRGKNLAGPSSPES